MKNCRFASIFATLTLVCGLYLNCYGQQSAPMGSINSTTGATPPPPKKETTKKPETPSTIPEYIPLAPRMPVSLDYFHPGILVRDENKWQGGDQLLNLTSNIGVYVTLIKPEGLNFPLTEQQVKSQVAGIFREGEISPTTLAALDQPPLPAFQIEILVYPIEKGYVASIQGRLFESVTLDRFIFDPGMAFEAITWEKKQLIVAPKDKIVSYVTDTVDGITRSFVKRFQAFQKMKKEQLKNAL